MQFTRFVVALCVASLSLGRFPAAGPIPPLKSWLLHIALVWNEIRRPLVEPEAAATMHCSLGEIKSTRVSAEQDVGETKPSRKSLCLIGPSPGTGRPFARKILRRRRKGASHHPAPASAPTYSLIQPFPPAPNFNPGKSFATRIPDAARKNRFARILNTKAVALRGAAVLVVVVNAGQQCPGRACTSGQNVHVPPTKSSSRRSSKGKGRATNKRRRSQADHNPEETDDEEDQGESGAGDGLPSRFLDCPFHKFDPPRYHRCGGKYELKYYRNVVAHLDRKHQIEGYRHCPRCWDSFSDSDEWRAHCVLAACEEIPGPERLVPGDFENLRNEVPGRGYTDEEKWFLMWDVLFAGHERPASAYVTNDTDAALEHIRVAGLPELQASLPFLLCDHLAIPLPDDATISELTKDIGRIVYRSPEWPRRFRRAPGWSASNAIAADVQHTSTSADAGPSGNYDALGGPQTQGQEMAFGDDDQGENPPVYWNAALGNDRPQSQLVSDSTAFNATNETSGQGVDSPSIRLPIHYTAVEPHVADDSSSPRPPVDDDNAWSDLVNMSPGPPDAGPSPTLGSNTPQATYSPG